MSLAPVEDKQEQDTGTNPTVHLFHRPCQPGDGSKIAYCGHKLNGPGGDTPWNGEVLYETCIVCLDIRVTRCPVCGPK